MAEVELHQRMWFTKLALILLGWYTIGTCGQISNNNNDKATLISDVPRTKFSCQGRGSGYYADVDTGCQVYHMCDGLGRQFSYACPNTTLFQQRMLVCDHWYMVNCSRAESNYRANLLIGQKDKPFVPEEENEIRTPRPDLLDRPYAPDYSGESYRKSFKNNYAVALNSIVGRDASKTASKRIFTPELLQESASVHGAAIRWGTKYSQKDSFEMTTPTPITSASSRVSKISGRRDVKDEGNAGGTNNENLRNVQLKFPSQAGSQKSKAGSLSTTSPIEAVKAAVRTPSKVYEPPLFQPDYSKLQNDVAGTRATVRPTMTTTRRTTVATSPRTTTTYRTSQRVTTTTPKPTQYKTTAVAPTTSLVAVGKSVAAQNSFKAFENFLNSNKKTTHKDYDFSKYFSNQASKAATTTPTITSTRATTTQKATKAATATTTTTTTTTTAAPRIFGKILHRPHPSQPTPSQRPANVPSFLREPLIAPPYRGQPTTTARPTSTIEPFLPREPLISGPNHPININEPSQDLQPPFTAIKEYDDASTQGPPIYYEWKWSVPAFILEPPLSPVQDSENSSSQRSTNVHGRNGLSKSLADDIPRVEDNAEKSDNHSATTRSVTGETTNDDLDASKIVFKKIAQYDFNNLQKEFLIPKFDFPLETVDNRAADRYDDTNKLTSFLVKIPEDVRSAVAKKPWYGENSQCPDCHPSFLVPGTCEPCIKIRR